MKTWGFNVSLLAEVRSGDVNMNMDHPKSAKTKGTKVRGPSTVASDIILAAGATGEIKC